MFSIRLRSRPGLRLLTKTRSNSGSYPRVERSRPIQSACHLTVGCGGKFRIICEDEKLDIRESDTKDKEFSWVLNLTDKELLRTFGESLRRTVASFLLQPR
jgi:hypothetical protein